MRNHAINWFDIAVTDFDRAQKFYETSLAKPLRVVANPGCQMGLFPADVDEGVGGAITKNDQCKPGAGGTVVYLNVEGDLDGVLARIPNAGGKVIQGRMPIPPHGFIGIFSDTEGNVVGLHSMK